MRIQKQGMCAHAYMHGLPTYVTVKRKRIVLAVYPLLKIKQSIIFYEIIYETVITPNIIFYSLTTIFIELCFGPGVWTNFKLLYRMYMFHID